MQVTRKVFVCKDCEFMYCDEPVSRCDCMGTSGFIEGVATYPFISDPETISDIIDKWHEGIIESINLHDALGWDWDQYKTWVETSKIPETKTI